MSNTELSYYLNLNYYEKGVFFQKKFYIYFSINKKKEIPYLI